MSQESCSKASVIQGGLDKHPEFEQTRESVVAPPIHTLSRNPMNLSPSLRGALCALGATAIWSGNFIVARLLNESIAPATLSLLPGAWLSWGCCPSPGLPPGPAGRPSCGACRP
jgi:drug/metabolite transporter (DMT)-like permease